MANPSPLDERLLALGQRFARSGGRELISLQEAKVLNRLIQQYRSKEGLSPQDALVGVAVLSELRAMLGVMDRAIGRGEEVIRKLTEE